VTYLASDHMVIHTLLGFSPLYCIGIYEVTTSYKHLAVLYKSPSPKYPGGQLHFHVSLA
jgi:hypothetical protein